MICFVWTVFMLSLYQSCPVDFLPVVVGSSDYDNACNHVLDCLQNPKVTRYTVHLHVHVASLQYMAGSTLNPVCTWTVCSIGLCLYRISTILIMHYFNRTLPVHMKLNHMPLFQAIHIATCVHSICDSTGISCFVLLI